MLCAVGSGAHAAPSVCPLAGWRESQRLGFDECQPSHLAAPHLSAAGELSAVACRIRGTAEARHRVCKRSLMGLLVGQPVDKDPAQCACLPHAQFLYSLLMGCRATVIRGHVAHSLFLVLVT